MTGQAMMTPVTVVSRPMVSTPASAARPPTKLRRIEPKPLPGLEASPSPSSGSVPHASQAMTVPLTFVTVPQVPQQFHIQQPTLQQQQQQQIQAQQLQLQQQIQLQSPIQQQQQISQVTTHPQIIQSPVHIDPNQQQQPQLLSPVQQQLSPQQQQTQQSSVTKKEDKRKEKHKQQQQQQQNHDQLMKDVKEEYDGDDAVSSSSHVTRFINASVQTPNKLLRMVAEEICGQSARKPHADRDFKVKISWDIFEHYKGG